MFRPTSAEMKADRNRPHVSFHDVPRVITAKNDEEDSQINSLLYINVPKPSERSSLFPVYEDKHESGITPPPSDEEDNERDRSDSLMIRGNQML